jgi:hypothetical protein
MRRRVRLQPYVSRELQGKLRSWAAAEATTESAVVEAALAEYLDRGRSDKELIARRLDVLGDAVASLQDDVDILAGAFGRFVRRLFLRAITSDGQDKDRRVEAAYQAFLRGILDERQRGARFTTDVRRARSGGAAPPPGAPPIGGR